MASYLDQERERAYKKGYREGYAKQSEKISELQARIKELEKTSKSNIPVDVINSIRRLERRARKAKSKRIRKKYLSKIKEIVEVRY